MKKIYLFLCLALSMLMPLNMQGEIRDNEGRQMYGLILDNPSLGGYGFGSFKSGDQADMKLIDRWTGDLCIFGGAAVNDLIYAHFYVYSTFGPISTTFGTIDPATGERGYVADYSQVAVKFQDMAYDYSTKTMYAVAFEEGFDYLWTINIENGEYKKVGMLDKTMVTLACTYDGNLYGIDTHGALYFISKKTAGIRKEMQLIPEGDTLPMMQSMEFDHTDEALYWSQFSGDVLMKNCTADLVKIDVVNKTQKSLGAMGDGQTRVLGLYIPFVVGGFDAPAACLDFKATPATEGELKATLTWTAPTTTHAGDPIAAGEQMTFIIERDGETWPIEFGKSGEEMQLDDTELTQGMHSYTIKAVNKDGMSSRPVKVKVYVGPDVPDVVTNLSREIGSKCESVKLSWETPAKGAHDGFYEANKVTYRIVRYPDNEVLEEAYEGTTYEDNDIAFIGQYYYGITPTNEAGMGYELNSQKIVAGPAMNIPYTNTFETQNQIANEWSMYDGNGDSFSWVFNSGFGSIAWQMDYTLALEYVVVQGTATIDADEWLISPPVKFEKDQDYYLSMDIRTFGNDEFAITMGDLNTVDAQTQIVKSGITTVDSETSAEFNTFEVQLPRAEGVKCVGLNLVTELGYSALFQINNVSIKKGVSGVDSIMNENKGFSISNNAESVAVNGNFNRAYIYNMAGNCVAVATPQNATVSTVDMPAGIYIVKVESNNSTKSEKIVIR